MGNYHQQCRLFQKISLAMFAIGLALPLVLAFTLPSVVVSPAIWNFLQIGGLTGAIVFWVMKGIVREAKPVAEQPVAAS